LLETDKSLQSRSSGAARPTRLSPAPGLSSGSCGRSAPRSLASSGPGRREEARPFEEARLDMVRQLGADFTVEVVKPFVVGTNIDEESRRRVREHILRASYDAFYNVYLDKRRRADPGLPLQGDGEYRSWAKKLWATSLDPYGYFKREDQTLVMNIATGGGTSSRDGPRPRRRRLPEAPAWFNEALGSLYEASAVKDRHILAS